jgi:hypothetical protein
MTDLFLPEDDVDFLEKKAIPHRLRSEPLPPSPDPNAEKERKAIEFTEFRLPQGLYTNENGVMRSVSTARILVLIPQGYSKTKLDSWYLIPHLVLPTGTPINCATGTNTLFGEDWQFWSRHLDDGEWRHGIDGLDTYFRYILQGLKDAQ